MANKVDNANLPAKLALRRYFLEKYHGDGSADVLDCCQGNGVLWNAIRSTHPVRSYWGLDLKPKAGRLRIDSARVLAQPGWIQNVVDIDTYGSPWKHWEGLTANLRGPTTAFLTIGHWGIGLTDKRVFGALGLPVRTPPSIATKLAGMALLYCVMRHRDKVTITEMVEAVSTGSARYLGVRVEPVRSAANPSPASERATKVSKSR